MKRKVGVIWQIIFKGTTWIKSEDLERLAKIPKQEERTDLTTPDSR